ncbi:GNAT family N-acetyltransferase [Paucibacter sediminis]|uniref:GNAT family N-acetyltransferase n=1 Tax=Paucibacter sediminis TaxID=3019553 RepID=A0AA95SS13_9BURK|nr:GNAT family N-acetyltransferase [Paucibacter sp. S2-9]WIT13911.1 GNAT family N-acetyltransferase [Paucibacter sp. S2-9]
MSIQLRPATEQDQALLQRIYASTRLAELALTNWDEAQCREFTGMQFEAQQRYYAEQYPRALCQIIELDHQPVGRLWVDRRPHTLHVLDISLLEAARGRGVGGHCLRALIAEAEAQGLQVSIYVELQNPARRLYERLGFRADGAPHGVHQHMIRHSPVALSSHPQESQPC